MRERQLDRTPRLGGGRNDFSWWRRAPEPDARIGPLEVLHDPRRAELAQKLKAAALSANGRARLRRVPALRPGPILDSPQGILEDNGNDLGVRGPYWPYTSFVGAAWITLAGVKRVRVWGFRCRGYGHWEYRKLFVPASTDREGMRCCWAMVFPRRYWKFRELRAERLRRLLERIGPPGEDDRVNLNLRMTLVRAHVPGVGMILSDDLAWTRLVQVVVRDPSTGFRHHMTVPPRFGNPRTRTFQRLGDCRARIRAAVAWTFGMEPEEYEPALEA